MVVLARMAPILESLFDQPGNVGHCTGRPLFGRALAIVNQQMNIRF
jgi:hypothetical protein